MCLRRRGNQRHAAASPDAPAASDRNRYARRHSSSYFRTIPRAALLYLLPNQRLPLRHADLRFSSPVLLVNMLFPIVASCKPVSIRRQCTVRAKTVSQTGNQRWVSQRRGLMNLIRPKEEFGGVVSDRIPPATQNGMSITSATRAATQLLSTTRPSLEAVMS